MPTMHPRLEEEFPHTHNEETTIVYQLQGRQAEFQYEKTSLSTSLNEDFAMEFSSFDFEDNRRAMEHLEILRIFKGSSYVVDGYFVDGNRVLKKLDKIFSLRLLCGILVVNYKAKLIWVKKAIHANELLNAKCANSRDFRSLIVEVMVKPYKEEFLLSVFRQWCTLKLKQVRIEKSHISCIADSIFNGASAVLRHEIEGLEVVVTGGSLWVGKASMVPEIKTGRRKRASSGNVVSASEACPHEIGTPLTFSDGAQLPDDTQTVGVGKIIDKFVIGEDFHNDEQAQRIIDRKAYLLYKDWRYNLKQEFLELEE
ncbi:hypothetical protein TEA_000910 [Camellia sinensis var. sinensis]|uniref:Uncharacterized protein n=1 Tax=Camellia sinensis var. sinensis TaxID=542762 RepID=A0A4S4EID4_CAMSN|nr:hypothetical protein TEA_000910 [Camellia sinensis var. sinensis]